MLVSHLALGFSFINPPTNVEKEENMNTAYLGEVETVNNEVVSNNTSVTVSTVQVDVIVAAMARLFYVMHWTSREEEKAAAKGVTTGHSGKDVMDLAPKTSRSAERFTRKYVKQLEKTNNKSLSELYMYLQNVCVNQNVSFPDESKFGHCLAHMALGTGVSLFDNFPEFDLSVPRTEFHG